MFHQKRIKAWLITLICFLALKGISTLVCRLCLEHPQQFTDPIASAYYKGLLFALTHGGYEARKHAHIHARKMVSALGGGTISRALLVQFRDLAATQTVGNNIHVKVL